MLNRLLTKLLIGFIRCYQFLFSPFLGCRCRFYPSCSSYAILSLSRFGIVKGSILSIKRILRCHPWHPGGVDMVPKKQR